MSYPQNGDGIVTIDYVTSLQPVYCIDWINRASLWYGGFLPPIHHCASRKFVYLQKLGHMPLGLSAKLRTNIPPRHVDRVVIETHRRRRRRSSLLKAKFHYTGPTGPARTLFAARVSEKLRWVRAGLRQSPCGSARVRVVEFSLDDTNTTVDELFTSFSSICCGFVVQDFD